MLIDNNLFKGTGKPRSVGGGGAISKYSDVKISIHLIWFSAGSFLIQMDTHINIKLKLVHLICCLHIEF